MKCFRNELLWNVLFFEFYKLYKEAEFNDPAKFGSIQEPVKSDQGMLLPVFLKKLDIYDKLVKISSVVQIKRAFLFRLKKTGNRSDKRR